MNIQQTISDFNDTLLSLIYNIAEVTPNSVLGQNVSMIEKVIKNDENKAKFIDIFVIKVLKYKTQIDAGDENFFLQKSYNSDLDNSLMSQVFEFKSIWKELDRSSKDAIIQYMQILCVLSQDYFLEKDRLAS